MTLIRSISGIRGTIGGKPGEGLTPFDIVKYASAYGTWIKSQNQKERYKVVVGRDARSSGKMVSDCLVATLCWMGIDVVDLGLSTTPTVELAVTGEKADGGVIVTASHNPRQWNALKLLNARGEFLNEAEGREIIRLSEVETEYAEVQRLGHCRMDYGWIERHIEMILDLPLVDRQAIEAAGFVVAVDAVNSTGGIAVPKLLQELGVKNVILIHCEPDGAFPHNPEPLPENLEKLMEVTREKADLGIAVDPDVDRLALVCDDGSYFGEEYTLVAVADYVLQSQPGNTVSNLSSTQALRDVTLKYGGQHYSSAVGEVNVVEEMKLRNAIIGGEGNGGVIYPELHYGRDALVGIALFLSHLAKYGNPASALRQEYPSYHISKNKITLEDSMDIDKVLDGIAALYHQHPQILLDGVRISFGNDWVHLRKSNTEPVIRIYAESDSAPKADVLAGKIIDDIRHIIHPFNEE